MCTTSHLVSLRGHGGSVKSVAAREDAPWAIATGARDGCVCLWDSRAPLQPAARGHQAHLAPMSTMKVRAALQRPQC